MHCAGRARHVHRTYPAAALGRQWDRPSQDEIRAADGRLPKSVLAVCPALIAESSDIDEMVGLIEKSLDEGIHRPLLATAMAFRSSADERPLVLVSLDPTGRVFCGTMPSGTRAGRLYRLNLDASYDVLFEGIGCPNGMGFTPDLKQMYFTDSTARTIWICDYDRAGGSLGNRREFVQTEPPVMPDGFTVDADGNVWSALWNGGRVACFSPDGVMRHEIKLPASRITSVCFGGADLEDLYVTSASDDETTEVQNTMAGNLFRIKGCAKGQAEFVSRIGLADKSRE